MDPRWPLVLCRYQVEVKGRIESRGCGRVPGTRSSEEAALAIFAYVARKAREAHNRGSHNRRPVRGCELCLPVIEHRRHLRDRRVTAGCELCATAHDRTAPVRHAR